MNRPVEDINADAMASLLEYDYPGNVRELENIMERGVALAQGKQLGTKDLPPALIQHSVHVVREGSGHLPTLAEREAGYIRDVLDHNGQNRTRVAIIPGIDRVCLWRKRKKRPGRRVAG
jgi:transcriptional regulator with PAS, ATPase and Fis domain